MAENLKRHGLSPLDLARFIRGRVDAGESNTTVAKRLGVDLTTVAHHLALLDLPPVLDDALKAGRCSSPRTLYELGKLHEKRPERVCGPVGGGDPITRDAVPRSATSSRRPPTPGARGPAATAPGGPDAGPRHGLANGWTRRCSAWAGRARALPADDLTALRDRVAALADRLDP